MDLICSNEAVPRDFVGDNSFRDTEIERIEISRANNSVTLDVDFRMRRKSDWTRERLRFEECISYAFYSDESDPYIIANLKFFVTEEGYFYASFDPYDETKVISCDDNEVVLSKKIRAYKIA